MRSPRKTHRPRRPIFRRWMPRDFRAFTWPYGTDCGRRRERRLMLSQNSMQQLSTRWRIQTSAQGLAELGQGDSRTGSADAAGTRRVPESGDREMVAAHQGGQHQGRMNDAMYEVSLSCAPEWTSANSTPRGVRLQGDLPVRQISGACPAPFAKIFLFSSDPNHRLIRCVSRSPGGALRGRHGRGAGCGGRGCADDEQC